VPIHAYLVVHPRAGPILVDTGISEAQARDHGRYYRGLTRLMFSAGVFDADEYRLPEGQDLPTLLADLGFPTAAIGTVILTHLDEDHVGGLRHFPHATVVLPAAEWALQNERVVGLPRYYGPSFAGVRRWRLVNFASGPRHDFAASEDVLGDGSLMLLPTPGHSGGHASLLVRLEEGNLLLAGDALYSLRHLDVDRLRPLIPGARARVDAYVDSVRHIRQLRETLPDLVIVPTHDQFAYQVDLLRPFLADGVLSADESRSLLAHEATLFDEAGHLRSEAMPRAADLELSGSGVGSSPTDQGRERHD